MDLEPSQDVHGSAPGAARRRAPRAVVALAIGVAAVTSLASGPADAALVEPSDTPPVVAETDAPMPLQDADPDPEPLGTPASDATTEVVDQVLEDPATLRTVEDVAELEAATSDGTGTPITVVSDTDADGPGGLQVQRVSAPADAADELVDRLNGIDGVVTATPTGQFTETAVDPEGWRQWGPSEVRGDLLPSTSDGLGTVVAVVDSGVQSSHPDLTGLLRNGQPRVLSGMTFLWGDPADGTDGDFDPRGHGTHVAGTISAAKGNGIGGFGVAPGAQILPVRVLDEDGAGRTDDVAYGILWAHQQGADVINLSLSGPHHAPDVQAVIDHVTTTPRSGNRPPSVVVASAGNSGPYSAVQYPAAYSSAIAVAATTYQHRVTSFSSWGDYVDIAAPGQRVFAPCTTGGGFGSAYCESDGTSMAAPFVSGIAAILRQQSPNASPAVIRQTMQARARDVEHPGWDRMTGWGVVDAAAAYDPWTYPPFPPVQVRLPWGYYNEARVEGRWIAVGGAAADLDGRPPVYLSSPTLGDRAVWPDVNGNWWTSFQAPPGTHEVCATILDEPTRQGVWLGCNQLVVK